jgi:membrane-associated phospholipid phosphatase
VIPLLVLLLAAIGVGVAVGVVSYRLPVLDPASPRAARPAARAIESTIQRGDRWRTFARERLDPRVGTGLLLTVGLLVLVVVGALVFQVRTDGAVVHLDRTIDRWADGAATSFSDDVISRITDLGTTLVLVAVGLAVVAVDWVRNRSVRVVPFLIVVIGGQALVVELIKGVVGRQRPQLGLLAGLGPSFPSGHTAGAAATYAACALVLGRGRTPRTQAVLTGIGVGLAIAVGASRVLLGVHWFSDVVGGLVVGWAWFALAALAFGGRLLRFGAPVEAAERHAQLADPTPVSSAQ